MLNIKSCTYITISTISAWGLANKSSSNIQIRALICDKMLATTIRSPEKNKIYQYMFVFYIYHFVVCLLLSFCLVQSSDSPSAGFYSLSAI
ncbi:hypothetical protein FKM82_000420 [Ascaphus truei]